MSLSSTSRQLTNVLIKNISKNILLYVCQLLYKILINQTSLMIVICYFLSLKYDQLMNLKEVAPILHSLLKCTLIYIMVTSIHELIEPGLKVYHLFVTINIVIVPLVVENGKVMVLVVNEIANNHCLNDFDQLIALEYKLPVEIDAFETIAVNRCWALACGKSTTVSIPVLTLSFAILYLTPADLLDISSSGFIQLIWPVNIFWHQFSDSFQCFIIIPSDLQVASIAPLCLHLINTRSSCFFAKSNIYPDIDELLMLNKSILSPDFLSSFTTLKYDTSISLHVFLISSESNKFVKSTKFDKINECNLFKNVSIIVLSFLHLCNIFSNPKISFVLRSNTSVDNFEEHKIVTAIDLILVSPEFKDKSNPNKETSSMVHPNISTLKLIKYHTSLKSKIINGVSIIHKYFQLHYLYYSITYKIYYIVVLIYVDGLNNMFDIKFEEKNFDSLMHIFYNQLCLLDENEYFLKYLGSFEKYVTPENHRSIIVLKIVFKHFGTKFVNTSFFVQRFITIFFHFLFKLQVAIFSIEISLRSEHLSDLSLLDRKHSQKLSRDNQHLVRSVLDKNSSLELILINTIINVA
ncbi:hypothetical protein AGLY_015065 [Aphis glycines]|uniref:Uncharacterized protein n=1 Tax=Aphis glycines TaxID=307491 RepID=A0A6G0T3U9_APHGL|nr:hypothetical protein AGLY_015065 [Aphis glycines]